MTYDQWKCTDPREYEQCYHEEAEIGWDGRAECHRCGESWWASEAEIQAQREAYISYDRYCRRQEFLDRWVRPWSWRFGQIARMFRRKPKPITFDEVPF